LHEFNCLDVDIEGLWVAEVLVPNLIDGVADEFGNCLLGCFVGCKVSPIQKNNSG
jgi:hypothetical protein